MSFLNCEKLSRCESLEFDVVQPIRRGVRGPIKHVRPKQTVCLGEMVVNSRCEEVLVHHLLSGEGVEAQIPIREARAAWIRRMPKREIRGGVGIHCDRSA